MKPEIKILITILVTFLVAFATSALYELSFINTNPVRYILVTMLIVFEMATGYFLIKSLLKTDVKS